MTVTLRHTLRHCPNDYGSAVADFERRTGLPWHSRTPPELPAGAGSLSVVVPAHNNAYSLPAVLDALGSQQRHPHARVDVIVVDDASTDATGHIAAAHPAVTRVVRLARRTGAAAARNAGTRLAAGQTVLYLDADMVLPYHVVADVLARAATGLVLIGFRHNVPYRLDQQLRPVLPAGEPDLDADHRVRWRAPADQRLAYTGITLPTAIDCRPLADTADLLDLGHGRRYHDWDLPRMVVTALVACPRTAVVDVGGFDNEFGRVGWASEDTYLGACLIAAGCRIAPLRQARGFHLDPPDPVGTWAAKKTTWPDTIARYWALLEQPAPGGAELFQVRADEVLHDATDLR